MRLNRTIWSYWPQGRESAPAAVEACLASWEERNPGWRLRCLDAASFGRYLPVGDYCDLDAGRLPAGPFAKILGILLLHEFGGVWVDPALQCIQPLDAWLPPLMTEGFFAFDAPSADAPLDCDFMSAAAGNRLLLAWSSRCIAYWSDHADADDDFRPDQLIGTAASDEPRYRGFIRRHPELPAHESPRLSSDG